MKKILLAFSCSLLAFSFSVNAADSTATRAQVYHPEANAAKEIADAVAKAKKENKNVLIQAGGNWCVWCLRFNKFANEDAQIDSILKANYVVYHLNYSKENKNDAIFAKYGYPQRFGFPVFIILNKSGDRIHTQFSAYLEENKGYGKEKVIDFLNAWTPAAIDPKTYEK